MLAIDETILSTTTVTPGKLSLGESEHGAVTKTLTVANAAGEDITYALSSLDAAATTGNPDAPTVVQDATARVIMPDELTVPAGGQASFDVTISPNELTQALYGGYVVLTPKDGDGASLSVPFAGFAGDYQALPLLENLGDLDLPALGKLTTCDRFIGIDCAWNGDWDIVRTEGTSYTMQDGDVPTVLIHMENPAQSLTFSIYRPMPEGASQQAIEGQAVARYEQHIGRDSGEFTEWTWDGMRSTQDGGRSPVPDGHYILQVEALSALGDPDNPDHVETWSTPAFMIDRDGDGEVPPLEPEEPADPGPAPQRFGFFLNDGWDGKPEHVFQYGRYTDEVLIGDWDGDGRDTITVRRGNRFFVSNAPRGGVADSVFTYGRAGDVVLVGDWNGDGTDTLAVRRGAQYHVKNSLAGGKADHVITYGRAGDVVMVGDWDGNGSDTFAVRRGATYYVKNSMRGGPADRTFTYGRATDVTLAGDWDGNGTDTFAVRRGNEYFVKNSLAGGPADFSVAFGRAGDEVLVGDWNGDGRDTLGVRRTP
ncbi:Fn3-like domain-containing protein [Georgenia satyanarayanai]|nr:Fn3-like domain-containing protein [Georgenia satyanarayanai]